MNANNRHGLIWLVPLIFLVAIIGLELTGVVSLASGVREWVRGDLGRFVPRPAFADRAELFYAAVAGLGIVMQFSQRKLFKAGIVAVGAILAAIIISWRAEIDGRIFLDAAFPSFVIATVFLLGRVMHAMQVSADREDMQRALAPRLGPTRAATIARRPERLGLPGQTRDVTCLVCRLRGFSHLADANNMDASGVAAFSRKVMTPLRQTILDNGGMIDHVAPGTLTAFFNAPLDDPEHFENACQAALTMIEHIKPINNELEKELHVGGAPIARVQIGIGIESGACVVGNFGTDDCPEYSVAGHAVERAGEIEFLCAKYGPAIIVGEAARAAADARFAFLEVDKLYAGANAEGVPIFALLGNAIVRTSPKFRALQTFHEHIFQTYRARQWDKTRALIEQCRALSSPAPILYDLYLARIAYYESNPPGQDWNGVFVPAQN